MEEFWRDIPGYNGRYQASNLGNIRSVDKVVDKSNGTSEFYKGKLLKTFVSTGGYLYVTIAKEPNKFCPKRVHRLIAQTFIPNPLRLPQVNHKNENKIDNRVENLEWCTGEYNANYGHRNEKCSFSRRNNPRLSKEVNQYDFNGNYLRSFPSAAEAARFLNLNANTAACRIGQCCRHLHKHGNFGYGYLWEFAINKVKGESIEPSKIERFVYQYSLDNRFIKKWESIKAAATVLNLNIGNICRACTKHTTCGGFKWSKAPLY